MQTTMHTKYANPPTMQANMQIQNVNPSRRVMLQDRPGEYYV